MRRRGPGEGSIFRRSDGRWCARLTIGYGGKRKYLYGRTRQEVAAKLAAAFTSHHSGLPVLGEALTVGTFLDEWLATQRPRLAPRTWQRYEQYVRLHAQPCFGRLPLTHLAGNHLQRLYTERLEAGASPTTVHHLHAVLHKALKQAVRLNLATRNVADLVEPPRMARHRMVVLTPHQAAQLLDAAAKSPIEAIVAVALTTGMRRANCLRCAGAT